MAFLKANSTRPTVPEDGPYVKSPTTWPNSRSSQSMSSIQRDIGRERGLIGDPAYREATLTRSVHAQLTRYSAP